MKAFLQTLLYSLIKIISLLFKNDDVVENVNDEETNSDTDAIKLSADKLKLALWVSIYSIASGTMAMTAYIGLKLIPVPDFVVLGHTASLFTLILSTIFLK